MLRKIIILLVLILGVCGFTHTYTLAHELKTSGPVSALLHINPNDDPIANQPSELLFLITDEQKKFNPDNCNCQAQVIDNNRTVFSSTLFTAKSSYNNIFAPAIPYTFPHKGIYTIQLSGTPKNPNGFQSFSVSYDVRVDKDQPAPKKSPAINIMYILIAGGIVAGIMYIIKLFVTNKSSIDFDQKK